MLKYCPIFHDFRIVMSFVYQKSKRLFIFYTIRIQDIIAHASIYCNRYPAIYHALNIIFFQSVYRMLRVLLLLLLLLLRHVFTLPQS